MAKSACRSNNVRICKKAWSLFVFGSKVLSLRGSAVAVYMYKGLWMTPESVPCAVSLLGGLLVSLAFCSHSVLIFLGALSRWYARCRRSEAHARIPVSLGSS